MKTITDITNRLTDLKASNMKIASNGLSLSIEDSSSFYNSVEELIEAIKSLNTNNIYSIKLDVAEWMFLQVKVTVSYLTKAEQGIPLKLVKLARNINAFDVNYQRSDDHQVFTFWHNLRTKLVSILTTLNPQEKQLLNQLTTKTI